MFTCKSYNRINSPYRIEYNTQIGRIYTKSKTNVIVSALDFLYRIDQNVYQTHKHTYIHTFTYGMDMSYNTIEMKKIFDTDKKPFFFFWIFHCCCLRMMSLFMFLILSHKWTHRTYRISRPLKNLFWMTCFPPTDEYVICKRPNVRYNLWPKGSYETNAFFYGAVTRPHIQ